MKLLLLAALLTFPFAHADKKTAPQVCETSSGDLVFPTNTIADALRATHDFQTTKNPAARQALAKILDHMLEGKLGIKDRARIQEYEDLIEHPEQISVELLADVLAERSKRYRAEDNLKDEYTRRSLIDDLITKHYDLRRAAKNAEAERVKQLAGMLKKDVLSGRLNLVEIEKKFGAKIREEILIHLAVSEINKNSPKPLLEAVAEMVKIYNPHTTEKLLAAIEKAKTERRIDDNDTLFSKRHSLNTEIRNNVPGYEPPSGSLPPPTNFRTAIVTNKAALGIIPDLHGTDGLTSQTRGIPRGGVENHELFPRDLKPNAFVVEEGGKKIVTLVHYDSPYKLPRGFYPYAEPAGERPHGLPPEARAFKVGDQVVWAVPTEIHLKHQGGNLAKTKDHVILTRKIQRDNPGASEDFIKAEWSRAAHVPKENVELIESAPGERTGHADVCVGEMNPEKNVVAIPYVPEYALAHLAKEDPQRVELARRLNNEYLAPLAEQLGRRGIVVKRVPMLAPVPIRNSDGSPEKNQSPFGWDLYYLSTVNWLHTNGGDVKVPVYASELAKLPPEKQREFHEEIRRVLASEGLRYDPLNVTDSEISAIQTNAGLHCYTAQVPIP